MREIAFTIARGRRQAYSLGTKRLVALIANREYLTQVLVDLRSFATRGYDAECDRSSASKYYAPRGPQCGVERRVVDPCYLDSPTAVSNYRNFGWPPTRTAPARHVAMQENPNHTAKKQTAI